MSAIIGVCGCNFCSLVSDGRKVAISKDGLIPISESEQKIIQVNNNVLFGATGTLLADERVFDPLTLLYDSKSATPKDVRDAAIAYLEENKYRLRSMFRNYIVGGKDCNVGFCLYEVHFNAETFEITTTERIAPFSSNCFGVSLALPSKTYCKKEYLLGEIENVIHSSRKHREMLNGIATVICEIADIDESVNKNISALSVY